MIRDYRLVSPSLEGVLSHSSLAYSGIRRPHEVLRILDGPAASKKGADKENAQKVLEEYFHDLHGVFMKKLSHFIVEADSSPEESLKLQALLQEMIKIKGLKSKK